MRRPKYPVNLEEEDRKELERISRKQSENASIVLRSKIILLADAGEKHQDIVQKLGLRKNAVTDWTARWHEMADKPVRERLKDRPRSGAPDTFTPEQLCRMIAIACESPKDHGRPITHWTHRELADEAIKQGILDIISSTHLGRLLKKTT